MILERVGAGVAKAPAVVVVAILLMTVVLGFFAAQTDMSSTEEDFNPDSEAANASQRINDFFGDDVRSAQIIIRDPDDIWNNNRRLEHFSISLRH